jgi:putative DNA primase/helicase
MQEVSNERADWVEFMQRSVGYSLTGEVGEQCFWMLYGTGAKGLSDNN